MLHATLTNRIQQFSEQIATNTLNCWILFSEQISIVENDIPERRRPSIRFAWRHWRWSMMIVIVSRVRRNRSITKAIRIRVMHRCWTWNFMTIVRTFIGTRSIFQITVSYIRIRSIGTAAAAAATRITAVSTGRNRWIITTWNSKKIQIVFFFFPFHFRCFSYRDELIELEWWRGGGDGSSRRLLLSSRKFDWKWTEKKNKAKRNLRWTTRMTSRSDWHLNVREESFDFSWISRNVFVLLRLEFDFRSNWNRWAQRSKLLLYSSLPCAERRKSLFSWLWFPREKRTTKAKSLIMSHSRTLPYFSKSSVKDLELTDAGIFPT